MKPYPAMKCYLCHRPMLRAAALVDGYPVGPVCAGKAPPKHKRARAADRAQARLPVAAPERDPFTVDLFGAA